jgi:hypothetical protein
MSERHIYTEEEFQEIKKFNLEITMYDAEKFPNPVDAILAGEAHMIDSETDTESYEAVVDFMKGANSIVKALNQDKMFFTYLYYGFEVTRDLIDREKQFKTDSGIDASDFMVRFLRNLIVTLNSELTISKEISFKNNDITKESLELIFEAEYLGHASISGISIQESILLATINEYDFKNPINSVMQHLEVENLQNDDFDRIMEYQNKVVLYDQEKHHRVESAILDNEAAIIDVKLALDDVFSINAFLYGANNVLNSTNNKNITNIINLKSIWVVYGFDIDCLWNSLDKWVNKPIKQNDLSPVNLLVLAIKRLLDSDATKLILNSTTTLSADMVSLDNIHHIMLHEFNGLAKIDNLTIREAIDSQIDINNTSEFTSKSSF